MAKKKTRKNPAIETMNIGAAAVDIGSREHMAAVNPDDVAHRRQFGHWEGDLMLFKQKLGQTNVTSLVERSVGSPCC